MGGQNTDRTSNHLSIFRPGLHSTPTWSRHVFLFRGYGSSRYLHHDWLELSNVHYSVYTYVDRCLSHAEVELQQPLLSTYPSRDSDVLGSGQRLPLF